MQVLRPRITILSSIGNLWTGIFSQRGTMVFIYDRLVSKKGLYIIPNAPPTISTSTVPSLSTLSSLCCRQNFPKLLMLSITAQDHDCKLLLGAEVRGGREISPP